MAVKMRLTRRGCKHRPHYRIVVADSRCARDGEFLEQVGRFDPLAKEVVIKEDRVAAWLQRGAEMSPTVSKLLKNERRKAAQQPSA